MEIIAYAAIAYLAYQLTVTLINMASSQYLKKGVPLYQPLLSILVPARNEEKNIGFLLDDLTRLDYAHYEILVYDDDSTDQTAGIVIERSNKDGRIRYIRGSGLPEGWLGKNHACHQLARQAQGEYLLFLDADVRAVPGLPCDALAFSERYDLELLSLFPVQKMKTWGEWATVPLMNRILIGNLPLILVRLSRLPGFSAANGQFMLFKAVTYKKHWFHEMVKNERVEDIRIIRLMKGMDYNVQTLLSGGQITCRMYCGFGESIAGFSKNIHAFFGKNWLILLLYLVLTTFGPLAVWISFSIKALMSYTAGIIVFRALVSIQSRQTWWLNTVMLPMQQISLVILSFLAFYRQMKGNLQWKGRKI
jgi:glycosyltransferase involved in cell wall biosynthesis